jgi:NAD(P)-dependent dehydrogenase (short-subunit alcohol dehydrogenase family)
MKLKNKIALITGASRGLGRALALAFARDGANLVLCARAQKTLQSVAQEVKKLGREVLAVQADVGQKQDVERLAATALVTFDHIDILVNNASTLGPSPMPYLIDYPTDAFEEVLRINTLGPFMVTKALLPSMIQQSAGSIVNVSSEAGANGYPTWGAYGISKSAIDLMTETWAAELEKTGVRVNSVDPGDMDTQMHALAYPNQDPSQFAKPESLTEVFLYLASDESQDITGKRFLAQEFSVNSQR